MRFLTKFYIVAFILLSSAALFSCKKEHHNLAILTTLDAWGIDQRSAMLGGDVIDDGGTTITARGVCWSKTDLPTLNSDFVILKGDTGTFTVKIQHLSPGTTYHVRAYATNKAGTVYGNEVSFETNGYLKPVLITDPVTYINANSAVSGGAISSDGGGLIASKGICWSTNINPTLDDPHTNNGTGVDRFVSHLENLAGNTSYHVRAYAINEAGTAFGNDVFFKTLPDSEAIIFHPITFNPDLTYGTVTDYDWNVYKTIQIGTQTWMAENLKTTHFSNGYQIADGNNYPTWVDYTLDLYCWYNSDTANMRNYGALYNWYAVSTGRLCPDGWHVPSVAEVTTLINFLGGESVAGKKLKETGPFHWPAPNADADNESGFTALPGGYRTSGGFLSMGIDGHWWCSTENGPGNISFLLIRGDNNSASISTSVSTDGKSVRCIKD